jgi:hypothetical protein
VADIEGNLSASYALTVDAGGRVAGLKLLADGSTGSEFIARANTFAVDMPNGTRVLTVNSSGLTINGSGTFSGNLSGAGGTFSGNLSAAGGTFNGNISGASGTFTGGVSGTGYSLNNSGLNLTNTSSSISIGGGVIINSSGIAGIGFSLTSSGLSLTSGPTATAISNAQSTANAASIAAGDAEDTANAAQTAANTALGVTNNLTSVVTVTNSKIYQGPGTWGGSTTGFYLDNNGFFSLKDKLTFNATSNTLTVNGSGTFTGQLTAGFVDINSNIINIGVASNYATFGEISYNWPSGITAFSTVTGTNTNKTADIRAFYITGGAYNGGGISVRGIAGVNPGELRVGTDGNGFGNYSIACGSNSISGSLSGILFSGGTYTFQSLPSLGGSPLYVTSGNVLTRASSSMRYKHQVEEYDKGLNTINQLRPVYFKYIQNHDILNAGFIAEEFEELGLKEFVRYDLQRRPDSIDYSQITALLVKGIQEQQQQIDALKAEIELLKAQ